MSLTGKRWQIGPDNPQESKEIAGSSKISPILAQILVNRGIMTTREADAFITPKLNYLANPYDIPDIEIASHRVFKARELGQKVAVWGDYDVDGVTGTSIVILALRDLKVDCSYYIPHRYSEGYGLNNEGIKRLFDQGVKILITVDCGISNVKEIDYAKTLGMDVIVTDHHNAPKELPNALALVNPKLLKGPHRSRDLSGAGVAFKFAWALYRTAGIKDSTRLMELFDLAGIGTIADIVPLLDENRVLAIYGLKSLNDCKRIGLKMLMESANVKKRVTTSVVNFALAPRLNSAGRLEHASISVELLLTNDALKAKNLALELSRLNTKRQSIGSKIKEEVFSQIDGKSKSVVLCGNDWNPGVIGIVASQVVEKFYRPAILIGMADDYGRGSARSIDGLNIYDILSSCRDLFVDFGGHKKAAGFKIHKDNIPKFTQRVKDFIEESLVESDLIPVLDIEAVIKAGDVNMLLASELELLQPHGEDNPAPTFAAMDLKLVEMRRVGDGSHLKARFTDGRVILDSIGFSMGEMSEKMSVGKNYDIAFNLEVNEYNGLESAQMNLIDVRSA
jgi:single-stranded-DNA-specific exonuclease